MSKYKEYKNLDLPAIAAEVLDFWEKEEIFQKSVTSRPDDKPFVFYEGPPSANGLPGIHHVMARAIKDIFCRYKTLKGYQVKRKAGWDTHGLPIELGVEKALGITKDDIGKRLTVEEYNNACRKDVMKYTDIWNDLTKKMGYWVDMTDPYITYENTYIESVWYLLADLYSKGFLYKGYTIQPFSPAAGTGLSSHELNQPGTYKNVKDVTAVAQFKLDDASSEKIKKQIADTSDDIYFLAWTTTPWTLPSNTALAVGKNIDYIIATTKNSYTEKEITVIVAADLFDKYFQEVGGEAGRNSDVDKYFRDKAEKRGESIDLKDHLDSTFKEKASGSKKPEAIALGILKGLQLEGLRYEQLLPYAQPTDGDAFRVILGDFVTTEDGTGIVHIAPSFGADDFRVAKQNGIGSLTLVNRQGKFTAEVTDFANEFVKEAYLNDLEKAGELVKQKISLQNVIKDTSKLEYLSVDERIVLKLQQEGKLFKKEKYEHTYPHCWRTDKPILYYPLDSWFIRTTAKKDRMIELNKTINWKPESTGTGRFGNWLENLNDWNLSRSRFWGVPLPIWRSEDQMEEICIGSAEQFKKEIDKSVEAGFMKANPLGSFIPGDNSKENYNKFDLHKPFVDEIILISPTGKKMFRESDLIDVWFDSGAMPYAQLHYPFENKDLIEKQKYFPADFIAEGVDQTRGWFFTLHAIATMCFDSVAYKNVVSNGLVLDKNGNKMSKRLGNATDPFETLAKYGPDATRWYMITNAQPWDNLKFDIEGIGEVQRKFFGTLYNTYNFFALYANIDGFTFKEVEIFAKDRAEIDRWILSVLNSLIKNVDAALNDYEPTKAGRAIQEFVDEHLSNWYVRLCRRRFWKGDYSTDKIAAYQTLYTCLETVAKLGASISPFFMDKLFTDLNKITGKDEAQSVHLSYFPVADEKLIDLALEERMSIAQKISSMVLSIRKKENIRVRQPLNTIRIPLLSEDFRVKVEAIKDLVLSEVNVKQIEFVKEQDAQIIKNMKLNFKTLGKKYGKQMKSIQQHANDHSLDLIKEIETSGQYSFIVDGEPVVIESEDVEIIPVDIPGWKVANSGSITVALDVKMTSELMEEGIARELVNRIQNMRKDKQLEVTDKITLKILSNNSINSAVNNNLDYICSETLATSLQMVDELADAEGVSVEVDDQIKTIISIHKLN